MTASVKSLIDATAKVAMPILDASEALRKAGDKQTELWTVPYEA